MLCSRPLFFTYFIHSGVYLLIPNPSFIPPQPSSHLVTINVFSMSVSLFLFVNKSLCIILWDSTFFSFKKQHRKENEIFFNFISTFFFFQLLVPEKKNCSTGESVTIICGGVTDRQELARFDWFWLELDGRQMRGIRLLCSRKYYSVTWSNKGAKIEQKHMFFRN